MIPILISVLGCCREDENCSHSQLLAGLVGCGGTRVRRAHGRRGVLSDRVRCAGVGGDAVDVANLTPPGAEPHDLELSGGDVRAIADADLVLYSERLPAGARGRVVHAGARASTCSRALRWTDPHVWLDPVRYAAIAERIAPELGPPEEAERSPHRLAALDGEFRAGLADCERNVIVTSHAAFGYLARYGLEQVSITGISPEAEPTARDLEDVVGRVRAAGRRRSSSRRSSPRGSPRRSRARSRRTAVLNPLEGLTEEQIAAGEDYFSVMRANLAALREALGCR